MSDSGGDGSLWRAHRLLAPLPTRRAATVSIVDQATSSVTNFAAAVVSASVLTAHEFGAFSIAYILYTLAQSATQSLIGQELLLSRASTVERRRLISAALRFGLAAGVAVGAVILLVAILIPDLTGALVPIAVCLPLLLAQDIGRYGASVLHAPQFALLLDGAWLVLLGALLAAVRLSAVTPTPFIMTAIWSGAGALAAVPGLVAFLRVDGGTATLARRYLARGFLGHRFLMEFFAVRATSQLLALGLGAVAGLAASGAFRAVTTLLGPLNILISSVNTFGLPLLTRAEGQRQRPLLPVLGLSIAVLAIAVTLGLWSIPADAGRYVLGETWDAAHSLIPPFGLQAAVLAFGSVYLIALRAAAPKRTLPLLLLTSACTVPLFAFGYLAGGVGGAAWGQCVASAIQVVLVTASYLRHTRRL